MKHGKKIIASICLTMLATILDTQYKKDETAAPSIAPLCASLACSIHQLETTDPYNVS